MIRYTYVDALNEVLANTTISEQAREKLTVLRDQQVKRSNISDFGRTRKPSKKQIENIDLAAELLDVMKRIGKPATVSEYMKEDEKFFAMSNQKVSALMRMLELSGKVVKTTEKRKSYFAVAGE